VAVKIHPSVKPDTPLAKIPSHAKYRMAQHGADIVIGGDHPTLVLPEVRADKWGGTCWLTVRHADADQMHPQDRHTERLANGKVELDLPVSAKGRTHRIKQGSLKWDIEYASAESLPADGIERFSLESPAGLTWHHQSALTQAEIDAGLSRPENVINSYAAYWNQSNNQYGTGKFAHLYRPEMVDASGNRAWATQEIVGDELRVVLPLGWLETATYPVTLDPTFGFESVGASTRNALNNYLMGIGPFTPTASGTVTSISIYMTVATDGTSVTMGLYDDTAADPANRLGSSSGGSVPNAWGWREQSVSAEVTGGADYWVAQNHDTGYAYLKFDSVADFHGVYTSDTYSAGSLPDPFGAIGGSWSNTKHSAYATYAEGTSSFGFVDSGGFSFENDGGFDWGDTDGTLTSPAISAQPVVSSPTLLGVRVGIMTAPPVSARPAVSAVVATGVQNGELTAPQISAQPVVSPSTLTTTAAAVMTSPQVSVQPVVSSSVCTGTQNGAMTAPAVSAQPTVTASFLVGGAVGVMTSPQTTIQPSVVSSLLSAGSFGLMDPPAVTAQPAISVSTLFGVRNGSMSSPPVSVQPEIVATVAYGLRSGDMTSPAVTVQPVVLAASLAVGILDGAMASPAVSTRPKLAVSLLSGVRIGALASPALTVPLSVTASRLLVGSAEGNPREVIYFQGRIKSITLDGRVKNIQI